MYALAEQGDPLGVRIITGAEVQGLISENGSGSVQAVETNLGKIECGHLVIGAGPWVRDFWNFLDLHSKNSGKEMFTFELNRFSI